MTAAFTPLIADVPRDGKDRPLVVPPGGGDLVAYTRVSTLAKSLDDNFGLMRWKQRMTAIGIGRRPDLGQLASMFEDDKRKLDEVVEQAMAAADADRAAKIGSALHKLTEHVDAGTLPPTLPGDMIGDLTAYEEAMRGIEILASEAFVVVDEVRAAGSFDRLLRLPDGRVMVGDIKTGQHEPRYPHSSAIQIATYSRGHLYDPARGRVGHLPGLGVDQDHGLLIHMPAGKSRCDLYLLNLNAGWAMAQAATAVRAAYRNKPIQRYRH